MMIEVNPQAVLAALGLAAPFWSVGVFVVRREVKAADEWWTPELFFLGMILIGLGCILFTLIGLVHWQMVRFV